MAGLLDFLQGASNAAASNVSAPVDGLSWLLKQAGVDVGTPVGGSDWMRQKGFTKEPEGKFGGLLGEAVGGLAPILAAAKAPQIARGLLQGGANLASPRVLNPQSGVVKIGDNPLSYQMNHKPMTIESGASPLHDLSSTFGDDIYGKNALQYFGSGDAREAYALDVMKKAKGNPNAKVTIYRGVPEGVREINVGDWVTLNPQVAKEYGNMVKKQVLAKDITSWADSLLEFGYYPSK